VIRHGADIIVTRRANPFTVQPTFTVGETSKLIVVEHWCPLRDNPRFQALLAKYEN